MVVIRQRCLRLERRHFLAVFSSLASPPHYQELEAISRVRGISCSSSKSRATFPSLRGHSILLTASQILGHLLRHSICLEWYPQPLRPLVSSDPIVFRGPLRTPLVTLFSS